jgi:hypothetical protein
MKMEAINANIAKLSIATLKDMAVKLNSDFREGADLIQSAVLDRLMAIMPEADFVDFCNVMEG